MTIFNTLGWIIICVRVSIAFVSKSIYEQVVVRIVCGWIAWRNYVKRRATRYELAALTSVCEWLSKPIFSTKSAVLHASIVGKHHDCVRFVERKEAESAAARQIAYPFRRSEWVQRKVSRLVSLVAFHPFDEWRASGLRRWGRRFTWILTQKLEKTRASSFAKNPSRNRAS